MKVGGLELGGIFGIHLKLEGVPRPLLAARAGQGRLAEECRGGRPTARRPAIRRVEALCRAHAGKGSPCDFISIHAYNRSETMAAKLIRAKEMALAIDPEYYRDLWVNSHESCPDWMPPPTWPRPTATWATVTSRPGASTSWPGSSARRLRDPRFAFGETLLTVWPPRDEFLGMNAVTRILHPTPTAPGGATSTTTMPSPIFHVLGMLSDLGDRYWVLPDRHAGGHDISGFASRDDRRRRAGGALHSRPADTQSRSDAAFAVSLGLGGLGGTGPPA